MQLVCKRRHTAFVVANGGGKLLRKGDDLRYANALPELFVEGGQQPNHGGSLHIGKGILNPFLREDMLHAPAVISNVGTGKRRCILRKLYHMQNTALGRMKQLSSQIVLFDCRADQERDIREDQKRMELAKKRLATLDVVMSRLYEDYALGEISKEKYKKMTADYEAEQERLKLEIETTEEWVAQRQAMGDDLDTFIALTKKYVDVTELTQTIVNEYIKKIIIHAPDKSGGKRRQTVEIIFNFVDEVEIPVLAEPMIAESTLGRRKTV